MAFCFDNRDEAAARLASRGGVNYRHYFIEKGDDSRCAVYLSNLPLPGEQFTTVANVNEAFDLLDQLRAGELGYIARDGAGNWKLHPPGEVPRKARDKPLVWECHDYLSFIADDGAGLYQITDHVSFGPSGTTARYTPFTRGMVAHNLRHLEREPLRVRLSAEPCSYRLFNLAEARAACEHHFSTGNWGEEPVRPSHPSGNLRLGRWALLWSFAISLVTGLVALYLRHRATGTWE